MLGEKSQYPYRIAEIDESSLFLVFKKAWLL